MGIKLANIYNNEKEIVGVGTYIYPYHILRERKLNYSVYYVCSDILTECGSQERTIESALSIFKNIVDEYLKNHQI